MKSTDTARRAQRSAMGMTLIEIMVVISIGVLLISALLFYVFPSDDRRCQLEANRLAAYLTAASAEALMRDGAARVIFDFTQKKANREVSKAGADITRELWEADAKAEEHLIKDPVELVNVNTPSVPDLNAGTGYINFEGDKTDGAVVLLGIEDAQYSVIVPPRGGDIRVEKGRVGIPGGSGDFKRPRMPDLLGYTDKPRKTSGVTSAANLPRSLPQANRRPPSSSSSSGSRGKSRSSKASKAKSKRSTSTGTDFDGPTEDHDFKPESNTPDFAPGIGDTFGQNDKVDPDPTPSTSQPEASPTTDENGSNGASSGGTLGSVLLETIGVEKPAQLSNVLNTLLQDLIDQGLLALIVKTGSQPHLIFGRRVAEPAQYELRDSFPSYSLKPVSPATVNEFGNITSNCPEGARCDKYQVENGEDHAMTLYISDPSALENACQFKTLELIEVTVLVETEASSGASVPRVTLKFTGIIRRSAARAYQATPDQTLADYLDSSGIDPDADSNNDGSDDSWSFEFTGQGAQVSLQSNPSARTDVTPQNCD